MEMQDTRQQKFLDDDNFKIISNEIKRQYNLQMKIDNSHDTKVGIMLGFIIIVLAQIMLNKEFTGLIVRNYMASTVFLAGLIFILYSGYVGVRAYFIRKYNVGPNISELIEQYKNGKKRDYNQVVSRKIHDAFINNTTISQNKARYIKKMFMWFFIGFTNILVSKLIVMVNKYG